MIKILDNTCSELTSPRNIRFVMGEKWITIRQSSDGRTISITTSDTYNSTIYYVSGVVNLHWVMSNLAPSLHETAQRVEIRANTKEEMETKVGEAFYDYTQHLMNEKIAPERPDGEVIG